MSDLEQKLSGLGLGRPAALTVGTFDGVHLGHRRLLNVLREEATRADVASVVVTFTEQPRAIIDPSADVTYLATLEQRVELLNQTGVGVVVPVSFDGDLRTKSADEFLTVLRRSVNAELLVLGPGARVGHDRLTARQLVPLAKQHEMRIIEVEAEQADDVPVSSSAIRRSLEAGDVKSAASMLGRPYRVDGAVVSGDRRGRELGFPTANIDPAGNLAIPADGIYATMINAAGQKRMSATSIGVRPTFGGGARLIEAFILDFEGDLYGQNVELEFVTRLRGEVKFEGVKPLIDQMNRDVTETRNVLSGAI